MEKFQRNGRKHNCGQDSQQQSSDAHSVYKLDGSDEGACGEFGIEDDLNLCPRNEEKCKVPVPIKQFDNSY